MVHSEVFQTFSIRPSAPHGANASGAAKSVAKQDRAMTLERRAWEGLGETVGPVVLALHPGDFEVSVVDQFADMEFAARDVFGARM